MSSLKTMQMCSSPSVSLAGRLCAVALLGLCLGSALWKVGVGSADGLGSLAQSSRRLSFRGQAIVASRKLADTDAVLTMVLALPHGQRCKEGRVGDWGDLGKDVSEDECKAACVSDTACAFAVWQTAKRSCTSFGKCDTSVEKDNVVTWKKTSGESTTVVPTSCDLSACQGCSDEQCHQHCQEVEQAKCCVRNGDSAEHCCDGLGPHALATPVCQTAAMVLALPRGQRCKDGRIGAWGNLGKGVSEEGCKAACIADSSCKFAVLQTVEKSCTSFGECSATVTKANVVTWESHRFQGPHRGLICVTKISTGKDIGDAVACAGLCSASEGCVAFSYNDAPSSSFHKRCRLCSSLETRSSADFDTWLDAEARSSSPTPSPTPSLGDGQCCAANVAECRACQAGQTVTEFCVANPLVEGCDLCRGGQRSFLSPDELMTCPCKPIEKTACLTTSKYDDIVERINLLMENNLSEECNDLNCQKADWAGCVLRMAGHDFMDFKDGVGGSDGCTDMDHVDNNGLRECLATGDHGVSINDVYEKFCTEVSLADFLVIAAEAVMGITRKRAIAESPHSSVPMDFRGQFVFGRATSTSCHGAASLLPSPEDGCDANERVFIDNLGLTWSQTAAIMGVHSLGRAQTKFSGYAGWWSDALNSRRFNNNYYISMLTKGWIPERNLPDVNGVPQSDKNQWQRDDFGAPAQRHEMMLNTDMCLFYTHAGQRLNAREHKCCAWKEDNNPNTAPGSDMKQVIFNNNNDLCGIDCGDADGCGSGPFQQRRCCQSGVTDCGGFPGFLHPQGEAIAAVMEFAEKEEVWVAAFLDAWHKATTNGRLNELRPLGSVDNAGFDVCQ